MKTVWLEGVKGQEREDLKLFIANNKKVLDILVKMMYNMYRESENSSVKDYDSPSWAFKQAHLNGQKETLKTLISICELGEPQ